VRLAENRVAIYQADDNPMDLFTRLRQQHGWHRSAWNEIKLVQSSPTKAHYAVQYTRYHEDGSVISVCDSLYIFKCVDGDWKLQGRSSFGAYVKVQKKRSPGGDRGQAQQGSEISGAAGWPSPLCAVVRLAILGVASLAILDSKVSPFRFSFSFRAACR
jgi:hypothetical protein